MLTQTSEHAIRALLFLARHADDSVSAERVADALGAPRNYLSKTLNALARRGIVASTRGPAGGFRLVADPAALTLARVVEMFEPARPNRVCLLTHRPCSDRVPCAAHAAWSTVCRGMRAPLERTTLADLLSDDAAVPTGAGPSAGNLRPAALAV